MLKERESFVNTLLAVLDAKLGMVSFNLSISFFWDGMVSPQFKDLVILNFFLAIIWFLLSKSLRLSEIYRSRPYSIILFNCLGLSFIGTGIIGLLLFLFQMVYIGIAPIVVFAVFNTLLIFLTKGIIYSYMKLLRRRGRNYKSIIIFGDHSAGPFIRQILKNVDWGYRIVAIIDADDLKKEFNDRVTILSADDVDVSSLIAEKTIDELIYCSEKPNMELLENLTYSCSEVGVVFRMYSPFFNMLTNRMHLHYFNTTPMLTFSNVPENFFALRIKRLIDFVGSLSAIVILSPVFVVIALIIRLTSKGPIFFKQKRVGVRGRRFWVYKFRTMVVNAEALREKLEHHNEMDGPTFKMTNDPRITGIGRFLRKTSLDELPQFFNVFLGDMSIVGPRPPIPQEVVKYERWQLRRLSMKPGITCIWQISPSRNDVSFEDWMRMDLEYIDNWSLKHDFVLILKTIRTMVRADGK